MFVGEVVMVYIRSSSSKLLLLKVKYLSFWLRVYVLK